MEERKEGKGSCLSAHYTIQLSFALTSVSSRRRRRRRRRSVGGALMWWRRRERRKKKEGRAAIAVRTFCQGKWRGGGRRDGRKAPSLPPSFLPSHSERVSVVVVALLSSFLLASSSSSRPPSYPFHTETSNNESGVPLILCTPSSSSFSQLTHSQLMRPTIPQRCIR